MSAPARARAAAPRRALGDDEAVALLESLVRIPSVSREEAAAAGWLADRMNDLGFRAKVDEAGNAVGVLGGDAPRPRVAAREIILLGHIDTVPGAVPVRREGSGENELLFGRGAVDAKGPLCAFVAAASRADLPAGVRLVVVGAVEEESASSKGARHLAHTRRPRACIIGEPSRWDGVTLGYKGRLLCRASVTRGLAHTARPEPSAAELAVNCWESLRRLAAPHQHILSHASTPSPAASPAPAAGHFHTVQASLRSIHTTTDGLRETAELVIGFRLPPGVSPHEMEQRCRDAAGPEMTLDFSGHEAAHQADRSNPVARALCAAIRAAGANPTPKLKTGTSDMNVVAPIWNCPIAAYGPGDSALDHTPNEHVALREYLRSIEVLRAAIEMIAADLPRDTPASEP